MKTAMATARLTANGMPTAWTALRVSLTTANDPIMLSKELPIAADSESELIVATQKLGLIYDGPVRADVEEDGTFSSFLSSAQVGWHSGKDAPRDPSGEGWVPKNVIVFLLVEETKPETIITELGFKYTPLQASVDGTMELTYSAIPVDSTLVHEKFELDLKEAQEEVEEPGV